MLDFVESFKHELRTLRRETEAKLLGGSVRDMEQYRHLMGRLEGYNYVEAAMDTLLTRNPNL
jgi:hypothetical protein